MTGDEIHAARGALGRKWGLGRALGAAELGRALRLKGRDPGQQVLRWEAGKSEISGPVSAAIEGWLDGAMPRVPLDEMLTPNGPNLAD